MKVDITRKELYAIVVLTGEDGRTLTTTLDKDVVETDKRIKNLINRYNHIPTENNKCSVQTVKKSLRK